MIIKYEKGANFPCFIHAPDNLPWHLEVDIDDMGGDEAKYIIKLTCCGTEEVLLSSADFHEFVDTGKEDEDEAILSLLCQILEATAKETTRVIRNNEGIVDIAKIIQDETEFWIKFWECVNQQRKKVDKA